MAATPYDMSQMSALPYPVQPQYLQPQHQNVAQYGPPPVAQYGPPPVPQYPQQSVPPPPQPVLLQPIVHVQRLEQTTIDVSGVDRNVVEKVEVEDSDTCCPVCFRCNPLHKWYELTGKGIFWVILLLLMYITGGAIIVALLAVWCVLACLSGSDDKS